MHKITLIAAVLMAAALPLRAQMIIDTWSMTTGVDTTLWYDIDGVDSVIIASGNNVSACSGVRNIGFDFTLGVSTYSQFSTNINGTVRLGSTPVPSSGGYSNALNQSNGPKIEPFGWRGYFDDNCYTRMALLGTAGNRVRVVETRMKDYTFIGDSLYVSFQVQLFETGGFRVVYGESDSGAVHSASAVRLQNGVSATVNNNNRDIIYIDFATHEAVRLNTTCSLYNTAELWPEKGRWYRLAYDSTLCPYPPAVNASSTNPASVTLQNPDGGTLHVVIPARGIDTLWTGTTLNLGGGFNPATTYPGTVQTVCGSDTSLRSRSFSFTTGCGPVVHLPWVSEFSNYSLGCWDASQYSYYNYRWEGSNGYAVASSLTSSGTNTHYDEWLVSPVVNLPNDDGLVMKFKYSSEALQGVSPTMDVRVAPCTAAGVVDTADWTTVMTLTGVYSNYIERRIFLDTWRGQTVKVAFVRTGLGGNCVYLDRVELLQELEPVFTLTAPTHARTGESVTLTAQRVTGVTTGLTYIWHSSLLDTTWAPSTTATLSLSYPYSGTDTVTLVVSNAYGADTLTAIYPVVDCPTVTTLPWMETFYDGSMCWHVPAGSNWHDGKPYSNYPPYYDDTYRALVSTYADDMLDHWIVSPAIQMPADTNDIIILEWNEAAEIGAATHQPHYSVLVSTDTNFLNLSSYDTLLTVSSGVVSAGGTWQNWGTRNVSLAAFAGQTIHVAFCRHPSYYSNTSEKLLIDNVRVRSASAPVVMVTAPRNVETYDTVTFTASLTEGLPCTYMWYSTLMGTTWGPSSSPTLTIVYNVSGTDTVLVSATNAYGTANASTVVNVVSCPPVTVPWTEDFTAVSGTAYNADGSMPDCWRSYWNGKATYAPHVINAYPYNPINGYFTSGQQALLLMAGTTSQWDSIAIVESPKIAGGLNGRRLSFYYQHESVNYGQLSVGYMQDNTFVGLIDLPQQQTGQTVNLQLDSIPASVNRFALQWKHTAIWYGVIIDNVELSDIDSVPTVAIASPEQVGGDSVLFRAYLTNGIRDSITYSWQSTMAAAGQAILTAVGDSAYIVYTAAGTDTVSVIATNAYGVDTAQLLYTYPGAPDGVISGPTSVHSDDTLTYAAYLFIGSTTSVSFSWQSTMAAAGQATMLVTGDTLRMVYLTGGTDTLTLITTNAFGVDTTRRIITVTNCHITTFPWTEGFENGVNSCWHLSTIPGSTTTNWSIRGEYWYAHSGSHYMYSPFATADGDNSSIDAWFILPPVEVPAGSSLSLNFYANFQGNSTTHSYPRLTVLVSTLGNATNYFTDTIYSEQTNTLDREYLFGSASLAAYAGQTVWIAFVHGNRNVSLGIDDISIDYSAVPVAGISGPTEQLSSEEAIFTAHLLNGDTTGITYTWHSTMADAGLATLTATDSTATIEYHAGGTDRVSVVIANAAGSDSVAMTCCITNCEPITQLPYTVRLNSNNNITCWLKESGWYIGGYFSSGITCMQYKNWDFDPVDSWFIMREIAIPADYTQSYTLRWHLQCDHSIYQVLVSTQGRSSHSLFDTLYYEQNDSTHWTSRTLSLDAYRGQNIYIAFRNLGWYNSPTHYSDMGVIRIDTIQVLVSSDTQTYRTLTLDVNDPTMGSVSGAGVYLDSSDVTISATPFEGYHFVAWNDNDTCTVRTLTLVSDTAFIAYFAADTLPTPPPDTVWRMVTVHSADSTMGTVSGGGSCMDSTTVTIRADALQGYEFVAWNDGDTLNPRQVFVVSDTAFTALFREVEDSVGIAGVRAGEWRLFPNPARGSVMVEVVQPEVLTLLDVSGREVLRKRLSSGGTRVDISALPQGVYFVRLDGNALVKKLIVR